MGEDPVLASVLSRQPPEERNGDKPTPTGFRTQSERDENEESLKAALQRMGSSSSGLWRWRLFSASTVAGSSNELACSETTSSAGDWDPTVLEFREKPDDGERVA